MNKQNNPQCLSDLKDGKKLQSVMKTYDFPQELLSLVTPEFYIYLSADDEDKAFIIFA